MESKYIKIDISTDLTQEMIEYIFDCWVSFVVGDLGLLPNQLPMILVGGE